jgi:hypothetical protein
MDSPLVVQTDIRRPNYLILSIYMHISNTTNPTNFIKKLQRLMRLNTKISSNQATKELLFRRGVL